MVFLSLISCAGVALGAEDKDEFAEEANADDEFEDLGAKPYSITVPLRIVGLRGSVPPAWLKVDC